MSLSRYFGINCIIMCSIFGISWSAEAAILLKVGDKVTLNCSNNSLSVLKLWTWKINGQMFTSKRLTQGNYTHENKDVTNLTFKQLTSESQLYGLFIENAQKSHEGNYTCVTTTESGVFAKSWELLITDTEDWHGSSSSEEAENSSKLLIVGVVVASCASSLILISLCILRYVRKRTAGNVSRPSATIRQQPREEIYENHLEYKRHNQCQCKTSP